MGTIIRGGNRRGGAAGRRVLSSRYYHQSAIPQAHPFPSLSASRLPLRAVQGAVLSRPIASAESDSIDHDVQDPWKLTFLLVTENE